MAYEALRGLRILIVEDDRDLAERLRINLAAIGSNATVAHDLKGADLILQDAAASEIQVMLLDMFIPEDSAQKFDRVMRGEQYALSVRERWRHIKMIAMSKNIFQLPVTLLTDLFAAFIYKGDLPDDKPPIALFETIEGVITEGGRRQPKVFIVHGQDTEALLELINFLQNTLKLGAPIVLRDRPGGGRTIIEKFESEVRDADAIFVLLTPDDALPGGDARRSRQNVIFELGFFYGKLQRSSGRIILLKKGELEIPTDIHGISYIDISAGVPSAGDQIRRELEALPWLPR
jgi:CheY-like chemotaxis protein